MITLVAVDLFEGEDDDELRILLSCILGPIHSLLEQLS